MNDALRALIAMCAAVGARNKAALTNTMDQVASVADPADAEEALLQSYLFVGYPVALQALAMWRERTGNAAAEQATPDDEILVFGSFYSVAEALAWLEGRINGE